MKQGSDSVAAVALQTQARLAVREDADYLSDARAALLLQTPRGGRLILWLTLFFVCAAIGWASWAELDEVTTGSGQVIPSRHIQEVQNLEGGILSALMVEEGDLVEKGQPLLQIDDTGFSSSLRESQQQTISLRAKAS